MKPRDAMDDTREPLGPDQVEPGVIGTALVPGQVGTSPASKNVITDEVDLTDFLLDESDPELELLHNLMMMC
jgi:hypothetical protein